MDNKLNVMFKNLCCSRCKSDFGEESIEVLRQEEAMLVIRLNCIHCGKTFGVAFLGVEDLSVKDFEEEKTELRMLEDLPPISKDDVLNEHKFIKNLDEHWTKYLP